MSESKFSKRMRDELKIFNFDFYRVESHATSPGIPDVHWLFFGGTAGWIETKFGLKLPTKVKYQPQQAPWLASYSKRGGNACTLVHVAEGDLVIFVPGNESMVAEKSLVRSLGTRRIALAEPDAWKRIAKLILRGQSS